jgi:RNA polymerase sigma factor (sigma-70 family)
MFRQRQSVNQKPVGGLIRYISVAMPEVVPADRLEFEAAVRRYTRALFGLAYSVLRDVQEAEDGVQDTMELAWRSWHSVRDPERRDAWLRQICLRRCLRVRQGLLRRLFLTDQHPLLSVAQPPVDVDLDRALGLLSPQQRAVFTLHYRYGYSLDDCAQAMGCRPGTARSHVARALATLRRELGHD